MIDEYNHIKRPLKIIANGISFVFHPLFLPIYVLLFIGYYGDFLFSTLSFGYLFFYGLNFFVFLILIPAVTVLLLKIFSISQSIYLNTPKERRIPFIVTTLSYGWLYFVFYDSSPNFYGLKFFFLGSFFGSAIGFLANFFMKISLHGLGVGATWMAIVLMGIHYDFSIDVFFACVTLVAGAVLSSRLLVSNHTVKEIYTGLLVGIFTQLIASTLIR